MYISLHFFSTPVRFWLTRFMGFDMNANLCLQPFFFNSDSSPFASLVLFSSFPPTFFWPFSIPISGVLGKELIIIIGQNSQQRGEGVQLFIFLWICQFENKKVKSHRGAVSRAHISALCFSLSFFSASLAPYLSQRNCVWANPVKRILSNSAAYAPRCSMLGPVFYFMLVFPRRGEEKQVNF